MAPLLEGETLGQRHSTLNRHTDETVRKKTPFGEIESLPEHSDADRLYKIDVAAKYRNVLYILRNLQSDDDLYVARALKRSAWLVADPQYSDIINPKYLETELYPSMTSRAIAKTNLFIRLHLKDEVRAEQFYKDLDSKDRKQEALKWLPICSVAFIEERVQVEFEKIDLNLYKRLCWRSAKVFDIVIKKRQHDYRQRRYYEVAMFLLKTHTDAFLSAFEQSDRYSRPTFKKQATRVILSKCPERVLEKVETYINKIDLAEFGKYLGRDAIKNMVLKLAKIKELQGWFHYDNLKPLIKQLPKDGKFEFIKSVFVDKTADDDNNDDVPMGAMQIECCAFKRANIAMSSVNISSVYQWYRMAPFATAFNDLKKLIRTESSANERTAMLKVLITSAGKNMNNIHTLLQYFRERHINEPTKFRVSFVDSLLNQTDAHCYDERSWKLLEEMFHSLELYTDDETNFELTSAVNAVVVYNLLHDKPVPDLIIKKFMDNFSTFGKLGKRLDEASKSKLFNFLRGELQKSLNSKSVKKEEDYAAIMSTLKNVMELLKDWQRNLADDEDALKLVKDLIQNRAADFDLSDIYNTEKKWRRGLFEQSLDLVQTEAAYANALKHRPTLMLQRRSALDKIIKSDAPDLTRILRKLRIYFPESVGAEWLNMYEQKLAMCRTERLGYKAVTRGVCILMERDKFARTLQEYVPDTYKVQWSEEDAALVNLRKYFAQQMYMVRPTLHVDTVLLFAKGDYLQYALPTLISVCHKKSRDECRKFLPALLGGAVSLQKHGIRLAFAKLDSLELTDMITSTWTTTKNASIRAIIFNLTFDLLCREKNDTKVLVLWGLLKMFMENLSAEENRTVYATITRVDKVPESVRAEFCIMSYKLLKSLPAKLNCDGLANGLITAMAKLMDTIDEDFVTEILLKYIKEMYEQRKILQDGNSSYGSDRDLRDLLTKYIIYSRSEEVQARRFDVILKPIATYSVNMWNEVYKKNYRARNALLYIVEELTTVAKDLFNERKPKFVNPILVFRSIQQALIKLPVEENYKNLVKLRLAIALCESYEEASAELQTSAAEEMDTEEEKQEKEEQYQKLVQSKLAPRFAARCLLMLKEDIQSYFPSLRSLFVEVLVNFLATYYSSNGYFAMNMLKVFTSDPNDVPANLMAISLYPLYIHCDDLKEDFLAISKKIETNENREIKIFYYAVIFGEDI